MRTLLGLFIFILYTTPLWAQNPTSVTGAIVDPNGIAYYPATVTAKLTPTTINPTVNGQPVNPNPGSTFAVGPITTSSNGSFSMALFPNSAITPGGTQWIFTVTSSGSSPPAGLGIKTFNVTITISGTSQDVGTTLSAAALALLPVGGGSGGPPSGAASVGLSGTYPGPTLNHNATGVISVVTDCGAPSDGTTDALATLNSCLSNPLYVGRKIIFPKTVHVGISPCDYSISGTLVIPKTQFSMTLEGEGGAQENGVKICSTADATGLLINTFGTSVKNLTFWGNSKLNFSNTATYTVGTSDGIKVCGPQTHIEDVAGDSYSRHGINFASDGINQCNSPTIDYESSDTSICLRCEAYFNRANGIYVGGTDSNVITIISGTGSQNGWFGFQDRAFGSSGSTVIGFETDSNHAAAGSLLGNYSLTSCSTTGGVISCIAAAPETLITGDLVELLTTTNSAYNSSHFQYTPIVVDSTTTFHLITGDIGPADGTSTTGGTVSYFPGFRVWATAGTWGGGFYGFNSAPKFYNCYAEGNQPYIMIKAPAVIYGGSGAMGSSSYQYWGSAAVFANNTDGGTWNSAAGVQIDGIHSNGTQWKGVNSTTRRTSTQQFFMNQGWNGASIDALYNVNAGINQYLDFYRSYTAVATDGWWCFTGNDGAVGLINGAVNLCMSDINSTISTGQTWLRNGLWIGSVEPTGSAGVSWNSGAGVPSAGTCGAANGGSLYSRTDGDATHTLYVCDNSTHTWTAK